MKALSGYLKGVLFFVFFICIFTFPIYSQKGTAKKKIVGVSNLWAGNDVNKALNKIITDLLKSKGYKVISLDANGDRKKQKDHVDIFIKKKFDGIIIKGGIGDDFLLHATQATAKNIPLIGVEMILPDSLATVHSPSYTYKRLSEWLSKQMGSEGKYMIVTNRGWHPLDAREKYSLEIFKANPKFTLVDNKIYTVGLDDPINDNYKVIKDVISRHPDLKGVVVTWGIPVISAAKAIMEAGKEKTISIIGCDAEESILALMAKEGCPKIAIMGWKSENMSIRAVEIMDKAIKKGSVGQAKKEIPFDNISTPFFVINDGGKDFFKPVKTMTPEEAWKFLKPNKERPW